eukprot:CAMPEP_0194078168 /NCGR_PEP_ID=MMETSP0149-20130528/4630_1 /TAXON_ID=122233 /ORGANISM="Chaetoceros debilis, Strain MM31A-1" /LENGTH=358 /DNA_ID=CAMNT_0038759371 /DNA_START=180 /DNA_END=1256 /DNA_ORIENTATION=+
MALDYKPIVGNFFLFFLIFGMSATVDFSHFKDQLKNKKAIATGLFLQFIVLPFLGFAVVKVIDLGYVMGITLLIITSSPGGAYSNWFCSIFNADLALSVTMTAISTILSIGMLPLNVFVYSQAAFGGDIVDSLDWTSLGISLIVVVAAISGGLYISHSHGTPFVRNMLNKTGNVAGLGLIIFTSLAPEGGKISLIGRETKFYFGTSLPIILGLLCSIVLTMVTNLKRPERVTVAVECVYQNTGIAMTSCLALFSGDDQRDALGVPFWYTGMQTLFVGIYCLVAWKSGWTKAPANENFFKVLLNSYEVVEDDAISNASPLDLPNGDSVENAADIENLTNQTTSNPSSIIKPFGQHNNAK